MFEVPNVSKRYAEKAAADRLDFVAQPGIVTGSLGPNRALLMNHPCDPLG